MLNFTSIKVFTTSFPFYRFSFLWIQWTRIILSCGKWLSLIFSLASPSIIHVLLHVVWVGSISYDCLSVLEKHMSPYQESLMFHVPGGCVSVGQDCFECDWSLVCGCMGVQEEKRDCLCECAHTFIQPPGEAESVECGGMPYLDWSSVLLLTGEFCTSDYNTCCALSHQRKYRWMHTFHYTHAHTHFSSPLQ